MRASSAICDFFVDTLIFSNLKENIYIYDINEDKSYTCHIMYICIHVTYMEMNRFP